MITKSKLKQILAQHQLWLETSGAEGKRANLVGANLIVTDLSYANLREANLQEANLRGANLIGVDLRGANLREADLFYANLPEANLQEANLYKTNLFKADLSRANLQEANLRRADLFGANLTYIKNKLIITFSANKDFAYYTDGIVRIGCISLSLAEWLTKYEKIGLENNYTNEEIYNYGIWLKSLKRMKL